MNAVIFLVYLFICSVRSHDIVGCGGFIQSSVPIKFEKVQVRLYTKQGGFKSKTECAPNNGYFLVAVYDKGDYVIRIDPPEGWNFAPTEISLQIDGESDPCSKGDDLNFKFTGFSINGLVGSLGREQGPSGVSVDLMDAGGKQISTVTSDNVGSFVFPNVMPGKYHVKARHNIWLFKNDNADIIVSDGNVVFENKIVISGYDVKGYVLSGGEPIQGVSFVLLSSDVKKQDIQGCNEIEKDVLSNIKPEGNEIPICVTISGSNGVFIFNALPSGTYTLIPYYSAHNIAFDVSPQKFSFTVHYGSIEFKSPFQVFGFSVQGRIIDDQGNGIEGVTVNMFSNSDKRQSISLTDGRFVLENVTTGLYEFKIEKENYLFDDEKIQISPNTPILKNVVVRGYNLCGSIEVVQLPVGVLPVNRHKVLLQREGDQNVRTTLPDKNGKFCFSVSPGNYRVEVPLVESEKILGFLLSPTHHDVAISTKPFLDLKFEQFRAKIQGSIECIEDCDSVSLYLLSEQQPAEKYYAQVDVNGRQAVFTLNKVLPGLYKVIPQRKKWCWNPAHVEVEVKNQDITDLKLMHSGYYLKCSISHNITLNFQLKNSNETVGSFELKQGSNQFCLKSPGIYSLTPKSCYQFEQETYTYNTAEPMSLALTVESYQVRVQIKSLKEIDDLKIVVRPLSGKKEEVLATFVLPERVDNQLVYTTLYWGKLSEEFTITPLSKAILFYPEAHKIMVSENCPGGSADFVGREGIFIEGSVHPPFPGVIVVITTHAADVYGSTTIEVFTDDQGKYRVGPVHHDIQYDVSAAKEGYHITPHLDHKGSFLAQKLAHITVKVQEENGAPMNSVLLSLSGDHQYRNNNLTNEDGVFSFTNLGPGQYFLRPMQKEYSFFPATKIIDVLEGEDLVESIFGKRVAFSCSGNLASLSGIAEANVEVEAVGLHKCTEFHEKSISDNNGNYRLRGLQPGCTYNVRLVKSTSNSRIERLAPENQLVLIQHEDINNLNFIVFEKHTHFYLSVEIDAEFEYLSFIKVLLYDNENLDSPMHTLSPGFVKYVLFSPLKPKTYVLKLQSSLSSATHEIHTSSTIVTPDEHLTKQHIKLKFEVIKRKVDLEPTQSIVALPLAVALVFLVYNYDSVFVVLLRLNIFLQNMNKTESACIDSDDLSKNSKKKKR